ncbi:MAG TPA: glycosyltransferase family 9 protein [Ignavibacteria bacterium]|nr:glycosyltransferase family 9 protein [Ignavibacteria bacterium]HMQ98144.1 glycosyltransferase family 9 protein [Ignavibacteria bacterium]
MQFDKSRVNKILIIKPQAIGDVLLSTPVIENMRHHFPDAEINFLTQSFCREALEGNPYLDRVLTYDIGKGDSSYCLIRNIHNQKYDLILDLFGNPRTAIIVFNSDARYRVGFRFKWRALAYNIKVKPRSSEVHNIEFNLDAVRALGLEVISNKPKFYLNGVHTEFAGEFFTKNDLTGKRVIGFNPSGTWPTKVWNEEKWVELGRLFSKDSRILLFWGYDKEKELAQRIQKAIGSSALLIPETNLKYMAALIKKCDLFVTNDTGPMHIAWVSGVNTAAIFGPTNSDLQGPLSKNSLVIKNDSISCLGCNLTQLSECPNEHKCMNGLNPEIVYSKLLEFMRLYKR